VVSYFLRYFSSTSTEQISPDFAGPFTSFDPVGFAIFATHAVKQQRLHDRHLHAFGEDALFFTTTE
jgi:hypothetical protein